MGAFDLFFDDHKSLAGPRGDAAASRDDTPARHARQGSSSGPLKAGQQAKVVGKLMHLKVMASGWAIGRITTDEFGDLGVKGNPIAGLTVKQVYEFAGRVQDHQTYGIQIDIESVGLHVPANAKGIEKFLTQNYKGIGKKAAEKIVNFFSNQPGGVESLRSQLLANPYAMDFSQAGVKRKTKMDTVDGLKSLIYMDLATRIGGVELGDKLLRKIAGYLIRPRGVQGATPMVVEIHGGPWARDNWLPAAYNARQLLVNRGYAVLQVNYRGSTGYGRAHLEAANRQTNGRVQQDIAEAVQWAVDQGVADPQRLAVMGGSFGGFSVLAQLAQKPHNYRCGVNVVGVANWPRVMENWPPFWRNRHYFTRTYGDVNQPDERADMLRNSPVSYLDQIQAPLLVIHGANDVRVLRQDSDDVVNALRQRGHPVNYLVFPNEGHSISKWRNRLAMWREVEDFFADCLGGQSAGFDYYQLMPR